MIRNVLFASLFLLPALVFAQQATNDENCQGSDNTSLSLYIPGFIMKIGSWCVDEEKDPVTKDILSKIRSISICVREGTAYHEYLSEKYDRKMQQLRQQNFEEWVQVKNDDDKVTIQGKQNRKG